MSLSHVLVLRPIIAIALPPTAKRSVFAISPKVLLLSDMVRDANDDRWADKYDCEDVMSIEQ